MFIKFSSIYILFINDIGNKEDVKEKVFRFSKELISSSN